MAKTSTTVYNAFIPTTADLQAASAKYLKSANQASADLATMRDKVFAMLKAKGVVNDGVNDRFRVSYRWGNWSWFITEPGAAAKAKGVEL